MTRTDRNVIILGGGLPGLSAALWLTRQSVPVTVVERASEAGGLGRTVERNGFRYDLGGHRFFSRSKEIYQFLQELLGPDLIEVRASAKIWFRGRLYDYPLNLRDILTGLGPQESTLALWSMAGSRLAWLLRRSEPENLEEWLVAEFGETLFRHFFKDYSEKVWGIPCYRIAADLASQRIRGVSLPRALAEAVLPARLLGRRASSEGGGGRAGTGPGTDSSTDAGAGAGAGSVAVSGTGTGTGGGLVAGGGAGGGPTPSGRYFLYPRLGIGMLTDRLVAAIEPRSKILRDASVTEIRHRRSRVETIVYREGASERDVEIGNGTDFISSIPLPRLLYLLNPRPPADVLVAARSLLFRDLVSVHLEVDRERITDVSWIYVPEPDISFGRIIEPKNWSRAMVPAPDRSSLVAEHYCFEGDSTWNLTDQELVTRTVADLAEKQKLLRREEVASGFAIRTRKAYPVYEMGYREQLLRIQRYLESIQNLQTVGRGGMFKYYNVAHLVESGIRAAENVFGAGHDLTGMGRRPAASRSVASGTYE